MNEINKTSGNKGNKISNHTRKMNAKEQFYDQHGWHCRIGATEVKRNQQKNT